MKTSAKYFGLAVEPQAKQHEAKTTSLMMSLTKKQHPQPQKFFFFL